MAASLRVPSPRWPRLGGPATCALALALFLGVYALRVSDPNVGDAQGVFFVVPVGVLALRFGLRGGLAGALVGFALVVAWDHYHHPVLSVLGYLDCGAAFVMLGALLGSFVDHCRRLEGEILRYHGASRELLWTADLTGRLIRVNPAWERTLGHSAETMCSRPLIEFVHPADREATIAEGAVLVEGSRDTIGFRNRCRSADGRYLWLEWSAHVCPSEGVVHGVARDITEQRKSEQQLANDAKRLEMRVTQRTRDLVEARFETLQLLAVAAEYRDDETSQHTERVGVIAAEIAARLGLSAKKVDLLREAAPLHDVGKLAIPDSILLKPGKLSTQQQAVMQTHATLGARLLSGSRSPVLQLAAVIAVSHHERWDGTGYPRGLAGEAIPLAGRVVAVADVFDALTHDRPYKPAWAVQRAIGEIQRAAGSQFDPRVVAAFLAMHQGAVVPPESGSPQQPAHATGSRRQRRSSAATQSAARSVRYARPSSHTAPR